MCGEAADVYDCVHVKYWKESDYVTFALDTNLVIL